MGATANRILFAVLVAGLLAGPAVAANQAVYDRTTVSLGALCQASGAVFTGTVASVSYTQEDVRFVVLAVDAVLKGEPGERVGVVVDEPSWVPPGRALAFAVPGKGGSWTLAGGPHFGLVPLTDENAEAVLATVRAHLAPDKVLERAGALAAGFAGDEPRLRADAVVDLYREPALLSAWTEAQKNAFVAAFADPARRAAFRDEMPGFLVTVGRIGGPGAIDALAGFLADERALHFAGAAIQAFQLLDRGRVAEALLPRLLEETASRPLAGLVTVLCALRVEAAFDRVAALASGEDALVREFAILGLGDLGGARAVETLAPLLAEHGRPLRQKKLAVVALHRSGEDAGVKALVAAQEDTEDAALAEWIARYRRFPARERALLLRARD